MIDLPELRRLYRVKRFDFLIACAAIVAVLSVGVLAGVAVGVALSLAWLVYVATAPGMPLLGRDPGTGAFREADGHPGDETFPDVAIVRLDGGLFFATADALHDRLREIVERRDPPPRTVVLDCEGVDFIDSQGTAKLTELRTLADGHDITIHLAAVKASVRAVLEADGVVERIGADHIHAEVRDAVSSAR